MYTEHSNELVLPPWEIQEKKFKRCCFGNFLLSISKLVVRTLCTFDFQGAARGALARLPWFNESIAVDELIGRPKNQDFFTGSYCIDYKSAKITVALTNPQDFRNQDVRMSETSRSHR